MAENDSAVLTAAVGYVFVAPVGTAAPTPAQLKAIDLEAPGTWAATGWTSAGHTSRGKLPEFGYDGGNSEMKGSWQKKKLREIEKDDPVDHLSVVLHQFDDTALGLYYGANSVSTPGVYGVSSGHAALEKAVFVVIVDGTVRLGFHSYKASVKRDEKIDLPIDDLASLPVKFTFLDYLTQPLFSWINADLFNAPALYNLQLNGATAGTYTLKVGGTATASIAYNATNTAIATALGAVDDGYTAGQFTVTAVSGGFTIASPAVITVGTSATTGGTGAVTVS